MYTNNILEECLGIYTIIVYVLTGGGGESADASRRSHQQSRHEATRSLPYNPCQAMSCHVITNEFLQSARHATPRKLDLHSYTVPPSLCLYVITFLPPRASVHAAPPAVDVGPPTCAAHAGAPSLRVRLCSVALVVLRWGVHARLLALDAHYGRRRGCGARVGRRARRGDGSVERPARCTLGGGTRTTLLPRWWVRFSHFAE